MPSPLVVRRGWAEGRGGEEGGGGRREGRATSSVDPTGRPRFPRSQKGIAVVIVLRRPRDFLTGRRAAFVERERERERVGAGWEIGDAAFVSAAGRPVVEFSANFPR